MELIEHLGGVADPLAPASPSQIAALVRRELRRGLEALPGARAGYERPLVLATGPLPGVLVALVPVAARLRTDTDALHERPRSLLVVASALEALIAASDHGPVPGSGAPGSGLVARYGVAEDALVMAVPWLRSTGPEVSDAELAALQWEERLSRVDRLRAVSVALPAAVTAAVVGRVEFEATIGHRHPLDELEVLVRAGLDPATACAAVAGDGEAAGAMDGVLAAALGAQTVALRPHADPDAARRIARRMLQMLRGKRKWSGGTGAGFHTEITHLTRGFEQRDRELAGAVLTALLEAGLLVEKVSVGQRHVSLLSRRAGDIDALVDSGIVPPDLHLPTA